MSKDLVDIKVPDIGDFSDVEIIEVLVNVGDEIAQEDPLITLETDKAAMDVPATQAGKIIELLVKTGDKVSEGDVILKLEASAVESEKKATAKPDKAAADKQAQPAAASATTSAPQEKSAPAELPDADERCQVLVLGAGPGGYTAAFRAADLGLDVVLVERWPTLGGVCLNVGCIPSKALLHAAKVIEDAHDMAQHGISFGKPKIEPEKLRSWKDGVVGQLTRGLEGLAKKRKVRVVHGQGGFEGPHLATVKSDDGETSIAFEHCIIAAGSEAMMLPGLPDDPRIMDSTGALELEELPKRMLVVGGGIIGLEMATVYDALGVDVSIVELTETLIPEADRDMVRPLEKRIRDRYEAIYLGTKVTALKANKGGIKVEFEGKQAPEPQTYGRVLVAVGRKPNGKTLQADNAGVSVDERGFISVDKQMRTNVPHIFAIGDIVGQPMLAHKATHEGKVAAEVISGMKRAFDARVIPSVAYTDPEVAWVGLTETQAKAEGIAYEKGVFPWAASGRSLAIGRDEGLTKILFEPGKERVLGAGIVGTNAGDLISEVALAIEMCCDAADIGLTIHPHPTLSETVAMAAEAFEGTLTDLYVPRKKSAKH
ncbi:MAG: dihydrolipoyl dehydrogenase [Gammaproteobacteria bacterium]|nr:dihydrolipoyl dehydrogenase [Gammaproteobacteria bacterium]